MRWNFHLNCTAHDTCITTSTMYCIVLNKSSRLIGVLNFVRCLSTTNNPRTLFQKDFQAIKLCPGDYSGIVCRRRRRHTDTSRWVRRNVQCLLWKIVRRVEPSPRVIPVMNVLRIQQWSAEAHCQHFRITFLLTPCHRPRAFKNILTILRRETFLRAKNVRTRMPCNYNKFFCSKFLKEERQKIFMRDSSFSLCIIQRSIR